MRIERAIEILDLARVEGISHCNNDDIDALKLGIEAMKRTIARRETLSWKFEPLLPGETTEEET